MVNCWAEQLGDCTTKSREHLVSACCFKSNILRIDGFQWAKKERAIPKSGLKSHILCRKHNADLSYIDQGAKKVFDFFRTSHQEAVKKIQKNKKFNISKTKKMSKVRILADGYLFEKWLLKTGINFVYRRTNYYIGTGAKIGIPPLELLEILFNPKKNLKGHQGLYSVKKLKTKTTADSEQLSFNEVYNSKTKRIIGFEFSVGGWDFFLSLIPENFILSLKEIILPSGLSNQNIKYHPRKIKGMITYKQQNFLHSQLTFHWSK